MRFKLRFCIPAIFIALVFSCEKPGIIDDPDVELGFSVDTVLFDTIFTTIGSITRHFKVYNPYNQIVEIENIQLARGENSKYRLNINGRQSNSIDNLQIPANDSIFIFVEVTLDPGNQNDPLVIHDSVVFTTSGNRQDVDLVAFGQDVHLINGQVFESTEWVNDKPYLIYNSMLVDSLKTLRIQPGVRIHFHKRSSMLVKGTLKVRGTLEEPVSFLGDRLEHGYDNIPGQWGSWLELENGGIYLFGGIHFLIGSKENEISYAIIKNAIKGIQVDSLAGTAKPTLTLSNTVIENMSVTGLDARSTTVVANNCVFANCGTHCVALILGGSYEFYHCTISNNYGIGARVQPALVLNNFYVYENQAYVYNLYNALFANCIITGSRGMEIEFWNTIDEKPVPGLFNYMFDHCLVKVDTLQTTNEEHWASIIKNIGAKFVSVGEGDYRLDTLSIAKDKGRIEYANLFPLDLDGMSRLSDDGPDLGAYERIEK